MGLHYRRQEIWPSLWPFRWLLEFLRLDRCVGLSNCHQCKHRGPDVRTEPSRLRRTEVACLRHLPDHDVVLLLRGIICQPYAACDQ